MAIYETSGFTGEITGNADLIPALKTAEGIDSKGVFTIKKISIMPTANCQVKINGKQPISIKAINGLSLDNVCITSIIFLTTVTADIVFQY